MNSNRLSLDWPALPTIGRAKDTDAHDFQAAIGMAASNGTISRFYAMKRPSQDQRYPTDFGEDDWSKFRARVSIELQDARRLICRKANSATSSPT